MKITLFGLAGTGTSTAGKLFAKQTHFNFGYTGAMFRERAQKANMGMYEFDKMLKDNEDYSVDIDIDNEMKVYGENHDDFIFEGRLAYHFIPDSFKIKFYCDENETARRVSEREGVTLEGAKETSRKREQTLVDRYAVCYPKLTYPPEDSEFDLVIDTTKKSPQEIVDLIKKEVGLDKEEQ